MVERAARRFYARICEGALWVPAIEARIGDRGAAFFVHSVERARRIASSAERGIAAYHGVIPGRNERFRDQRFDNHDIGELS